MKNTYRGIAVVLGLAFGAYGHAQDDNLSYTYFEAAYANLDIDFVDDESNLLDDFDDGGGWAVASSFAFTPRFFGFANYSETEADVSFIDPNSISITSNQDINRLSAGLGFNIPVLEGRFSRADFVGRAAYMDVDLGEFSFGASDSDVLDNFEGAIDDLNEDSSDGFFVDASLRAQLSRPIEASAGVRYSEIGDSDDVSFIGNLLWEFNPNWGLNISADIGDELSVWTLGVRYSFHQT